MVVSCSDCELIRRGENKEEGTIMSETNWHTYRGPLLLVALVIYYIWLIIGTENSVKKSVFPSDNLLDFVSTDHAELGAIGSKLEVHPFDEGRASLIKVKLHTKPGDMHNASEVRRGTHLSHAWSDDELLRTALRSERLAMKQMAGQGITLADIQQKIAFMFLVERDLGLEPLWARFLSGNENRYNLYVHMDPSQPGVLGGVFRGRAIPGKEVQPNTPAFAAAARRLLANAVLGDPLNEWFVLVSDGALPLHSFYDMYEKLESTKQSFIEINTRKTPLLWQRYISRGLHALEPEVSWADFRMGSKWWILRKRHALMILEDKRYWNKFTLPCLADNKKCAPEEHYFSTVLNLLDKNGTTGKPITFQYDKGGLQSDRPTTFRCSQINGTLFSQLQSKNQWLFAQRFSTICKEKLLLTTRKIYHSRINSLTD
ncbi:hypothetical protein R1sor_002487 [Riccia sorocarpa]|uniref:Uncharacterized protein n=1 Tax=Riccia sorocarpa TaxID=122646 RepID=A0ABD3GYY7_9MARC